MEFIQKNADYRSFLKIETRRTQVDEKVDKFRYNNTIRKGEWLCVLN